MRKNCLPILKGVIIGIQISLIYGYLAAPALAMRKFVDSLRATANQAGYDTATAGKEAEFFSTTIGMGIALFLSLLGVIFLALMIYSGFKWMLSQGNEQEIDHARKTIRNAAIGLIIVVAAFAITAYIGKAINLAPVVETNS